MSDSTADYKEKNRGFENCIEADECHDIALTGSGTVDRSGGVLVEALRQAENGGRGCSDSRASPLHDRAQELPKRVHVEGVTLTNSPSFHLVPQLCQEVVIEKVHFLAPRQSS